MQRHCSCRCQVKSCTSMEKRERHIPGPYTENARSVVWAHGTLGTKIPANTSAG